MPSVKNDYQDEAVARSYDGSRFRGIGWILDKLERRALRRTFRHIRKVVADPAVLDVPCGTGRITEFLLGQGLDVTGGDISQAMMEVARHKCRHFPTARFVPLDLDRLDLPDRSFDVVTCIRLFHHLDTQERERTLKELARVTRRFVVVNVSYSSRFYRCRRRLKGWLGQGVSPTSSTWVEILREAAAAGLRVIGCCFCLRFLSEDLVLLMETI